MGSVKTSIPGDLDPGDLDLVVQHLTLARAAEALAVSWHTQERVEDLARRPTEEINRRLENLRGSALGFRNQAHIARSLLEAGDFRPLQNPRPR
jgi:hypothetical protein